MIISEQITGYEVVDDHITMRLRDLHTSMPAIVRSYDPAANTVNVTPVQHREIEDGDDNVESEALPDLHDVPIAWPRGGGFMITFPIKAGDEVLLVFAERNVGTWRASGSDGPPGDLGMHTLDGAIAIPGVGHDGALISTASTANMTMGKDGLATSQIEITPLGVNIGAGATQPILKGDEAVAALQTYVAGVGAAIAAINVWAGKVAIAVPAVAADTVALVTALTATYPAVVTAYATAMNLSKSLTSKVK